MSRSILAAAAAVFLAACSSPAPETSTSLPPPPEEPTSTTVTPPRPDETVEAVVEEAVEEATSFDASYLSLGPGRAFPALDDPPMVAGSSAGWLEADDIVLGIVTGGEAHAFPASQLAYHHIVNTTIAGEPYLVTY